MTAARNGRSAAPSAGASSPTASAAVQNSPAPAPASREETPQPAASVADPAPVLPGTTTPEPASAPNAEAQEPAADPNGTAETPTAPEAGAALALLEDPDSEPAGPDAGKGPDARTVDGWVRQLDELLKTGDHPKAIRELQKRLHAVVDQRDMERNARLEAERRAEERTTEPQATAPVAQGHPVLAPLDQQIQETRNAVTLVEQYLDAVATAQREGTDVPRHITLANGEPWADPKGRPIEVDPEKARHWRRQYEERISDLKMDRKAAEQELVREHRAATQQAMGAALVHYPWLANKSAPEFADAQALLRERPGLKQNADWPVIVGDYISGKRAREAAAAKAKLPVKAPPMTRPKGGNIPPTVGTQPGAAAAMNGEGRATVQKQVQEARERYRKTGSVKDRAELSRLERQQQSAA